ncbi:MAG TPA: alpha/beta fold hydrolase [Nocardioidaceae bacterium]|nr:alpha/beta fold hydrolase [Nocardioidaceae bacterium]
MNRVRVRTLLVPLLALVVALLAVPVTAAAAAGPSYPYPTLGWPPAGANDWSCAPTRERPYPAVIVHGTFGDQKSLLDNLSFSLKRDGYCVFALDYGNRATGPVEESAAELKQFVDKVRDATGAAKVQIVGHSQGGMMPRYYIKNLGGAPFVEDLVGLSPSNHGTYSAQLLAPTETFCYSCTQQAADSAFLAELNSGDETPGDVDYTQVSTRYDEVVVPYSSAFLADSPQSTNITLQDHCRLDAAEHLTIPLDPQAIRWVLDAFDRDGPADPRAAIGCL